MIMDKEWMVRYGEKNMSHLIDLLVGEYEEQNPAKRDVPTIIHLTDAINFYDTVLCLMNVVSPNFDVHLKKIHSKESEEEDQDDETADQDVREENSTQNDRGDS